MFTKDGCLIGEPTVNREYFDKTSWGAKPPYFDELLDHRLKEKGVKAVNCEWTKDGIDVLVEYL